MKRGDNGKMNSKTGQKTQESKVSLIPKNLAQLKTLESLIQTRLNYSGILGESYGGSRNLYQVLGYDKTVGYEQYLFFFKREDIAKTLIEKLPKACWTNPPTITDEQEDSEFEKEYEKFVKAFKLYSLLFRADKLMGLGTYGILFLGFNDAKSNQLHIEVTPSNTLELLYIQPYSEQTAKIHEIESDPTNPRFGLPKIYQISITDTYNSLTGGSSTSNQSMLVHHSRIIHLLEDPLENEVEGTPKLEAIYNRIQDTRKILGGSAEMFWRAGVPGKVAKADEKHTMGLTDKEDLQAQFDEYEHNLRRFLTVQGVDITNLETDIASPKDSLEAQLNIISVVTGIPKRILIGSERGELASSQDQETWNHLIGDRQVDLCSPVFLRPLIDKLIDYKILPSPKNDDYMINWPILIAIGEKEKAEIAEIRMKTVKEYVSAPGADMLIPQDIFLRDELGYKQEQIEEIKKQQGELPDLEEDGETGEEE